MRMNFVPFSKKYKNSITAFTVSELIAILIIIGIIATIIFTSVINKQNKNKNQYQPQVVHVTAKELEAKKVTITIQNDYNYDPMECMLLDSDTCTYLSQNSKMQGGIYKIINVGGYKTWNEAKKICGQINSTPANIAQLKKLYIDGILKCQDGTKSCDFWAYESTKNGLDGIILNAYSGLTDHYKKEQSEPLLQVLCINQ